MEPPEKKNKRKKTTTTKKKSSSPPFPHPSFSSLPDDITVNFLARIPRSYYPRLSIVSRSFRSILSSTELYTARSHLGSTEECLYVCLFDRDRYEFPQWYRLWINPNRIKKKRKKSIKQLLVPIPSSDFASMAGPLVVGSEIYVIGGRVDNDAPSSAVRVLDCRSHTWRDAPSMNVARKNNAATCFYDGKIYIIGGMKKEDEESSFAEVFDIESQTWECLPDPGTEIRKCYVCTVAEIDGTINFGNSSKMYGYNTKQGEWERTVNIGAVFARSGCVIENESYYFMNYLEWRDINGGPWEKLKGLDSFVDFYRRNGGSASNTTEVSSCGGKLYVMWEGCMRRNCDHKKKIWCAEISLEKRDRGEIWGNVEWIDSVLIVPKSFKLLHVLPVSV